MGEEIDKIGNVYCLGTFIYIQFGDTGTDFGGLLDRYLHTCLLLLCSVNYCSTLNPTIRSKIILSKWLLWCNMYEPGGFYKKLLYYYCTPQTHRGKIHLTVSHSHSPMIKVRLGTRSTWLDLEKLHDHGGVTVTHDVLCNVQLSLFCRCITLSPSWWNSWYVQHYSYSLPRSTCIYYFMSLMLYFSFPSALLSMSLCQHLYMRCSYKSTLTCFTWHLSNKHVCIPCKAM